MLKEHVATGTHELWGLKSLALHVNTALLGAGGLVATATAFVGLVTTRVRSALSTLEGVKAKLDKAMDDQLARPKEQVEIEQKKLAELTANVTEAKARLDDTTDRLAEAAREYASGTGRGRLMRFVRERATDAQYSQHLGLVATVRRVFSQLSTMMAAATTPVSAAAATAEQAKDVFTRRVDSLLEAARKDQLLTEPETRKLEQSNAPPPDVKAVFERIILYIDDLDRCPPSKVVQVLQAVHLLLSFPLFVVIVAVDARWVGSSLETHYGKLLKRQKGFRLMPRRVTISRRPGALLGAAMTASTAEAAGQPGGRGRELPDRPPFRASSRRDNHHHWAGAASLAKRSAWVGQAASAHHKYQTRLSRRQQRSDLAPSARLHRGQIAFMQAAPYVRRTPRRACAS